MGEASALDAPAAASPATKCTVADAGTASLEAAAPHPNLPGTPPMPEPGRRFHGACPPPPPGTPPTESRVNEEGRSRDAPSRTAPSAAKDPWCINDPWGGSSTTSRTGVTGPSQAAQAPAPVDAQRQAGTGGAFAAQRQPQNNERGSVGSAACTSPREGRRLVKASDDGPSPGSIGSTRSSGGEEAPTDSASEAISHQGMGRDEEVPQPGASNPRWCQYSEEAADGTLAGRWWWCEADSQWFREREPGPWKKFLDPTSGRHYWWHSNNGAWFWTHSGTTEL